MLFERELGFQGAYARGSLDIETTLIEQVREVLTRRGRDRFSKVEFWEYNSLGGIQRVSLWTF